MYAGISRVAVAQIEPALGEKERNLAVCLARMEEAAAAGAELLVLPECAIPGYVFESVEEALPYAEPVPGPATDALAEACSRLGSHVVCGLLEVDGTDLDVTHPEPGLDRDLRREPLPPRAHVHGAVDAGLRQRRHQLPDVHVHPARVGDTGLREG